MTASCFIKAFQNNGFKKFLSVRIGAKQRMNDYLIIGARQETAEPPQQV